MKPHASEDTAPAAKTSELAKPKGFKVGKAFSTHNRRFAVNTVLTDEDIKHIDAESVLDLEHLKVRGFIVTA